jgi:hypothetical protein
MSRHFGAGFFIVHFSMSKKIHQVLFFALITIMQACSQEGEAQHFLRPPVGEQRANYAQLKPEPEVIIADSSRMMTTLRQLSADSMEGRKTGTLGSTKARQFIVSQLLHTQVRPLPGHDDFLQPFSFSHLTGRNIIGMIQGSAITDSVLVVSAHYDHIGIKNGDVFNGADDNASGVSVLLEAVHYFSQHPPRHSIIFCFFDGEEMGLQGSRYFVEHLPAGKHVFANINFDMLSRNQNGNELFACGTMHYPQFYYLLQPLVKRHPVALLFGHDGEQPSKPGDDWTYQSDHGSFHKKRIPFIYLGVEDHDDYHKQSDEFEKIDKSFFLHAAHLALDVVISMDSHANAENEKRPH